MANKTILVPFDFTPCSQHGLEYAVKVAQKNRHRLILVHTFYNSLAEVRINTKSTTATQEEKVHAELKKMAEHIKLHEGVNCDYLTGSDPIPQLLEKLIKVKRAGLVIMGTRGAGGLNEFIWGTWAADVVRYVKKPVMVIPEKASLPDITRMVFATDLHESDLTAIREMITLAKTFEAHLEILHISRGEIVSDEENQRMEDFMNLIERKINFVDITYRILAGKKIEKVLEQYFIDHKIDLIGLSTRHRSWIERIIESSLTEKMVMHSHIPLMVFHYEQKTIVLI